MTPHASGAQQRGGDRPDIGAAIQVAKDGVGVRGDQVDGRTAILVRIDHAQRRFARHGERRASGFRHRCHELRDLRLGRGEIHAGGQPHLDQEGRARGVGAPVAVIVHVPEASRRQRLTGSAVGVGSVGFDETGAFDVGADDHAPQDDAVTGKP